MVDSIPLFVIIPLLSAFIISIMGRFTWRLFVYTLSCASCFIVLALSFYELFSLQNSAAGVLVYKIGGWALPFGICMVLDGLSVFMLVTVNLLALFVAIYSVNYMTRYTDRAKFYVLFFMMITGMNGVIVAGDIFNLFVFLEVASVSSYALVAFGTEAEELEAAFKYIIMGTVASAFIFLGIAFLYSFTSTLNLADISLALSHKTNTWLVVFVSVLFFAGFGLKAALVPFHAWLVDAHSSAPASISAMLSGVLIKTLGIYSMARIFFNVFGASQDFLSAMVFFGAASIVVGSILMLPQWRLKRLLAYSSISQIGYIALGIGIGTPLGMLGAIFHIFNHSVCKGLLFLNAGAIDYELNTQDLRQIAGAGKRMPITDKTNLLASMALSGVPPFCGFCSKLIIIFACIQRGSIAIAMIAACGSILTMAGFMKVRRFAFSGGGDCLSHKDVKEAPYLMRFSMVCLAFICVTAGLLLLPQARFFLKGAATVLLNGKDYARMVFEAAAR